MKSSIILYRCPSSSMGRGTIRPEQFYPALVTDSDDKYISFKLFHPEQVVQKDGVPLMVPAPDPDDIAKHRDPPRMIPVPNPDIQFLPDWGVVIDSMDMRIQYLEEQVKSLQLLLSAELEPISGKKGK